MKDKQIRKNRLLPISVFIILVLTLTPGDGKIMGNFVDKIAHFLMFLILSINICYSYQKNEKLIEVMFWAILFGLLTEVIQQFIPGRNMDIYDGIADFLGIMLGFYLYQNIPVRFDKMILKFNRPK